MTRVPTALSRFTAHVRSEPVVGARGDNPRCANTETRHEPDLQRAFSVMVLIGIGNTINIHHRDTAHDDAPQRP
ncbi:MAG: hypothetical protein RML73_03985 [Anaerolineae bacterium]|nr:hypothetical protein [Anaerolineae bacterium]